MLRTRRTDLPKEGRIGDTIQFIRNAVVVGGQDWGNPIADLLQEIPISAAVDQAMSQGTTGTELTRKYRRALTLILCALNNVPPARAQQLVAQYSDQNLPTALGTMFSDVQRVCMPQRLNPPLQQLLAAPAVFLAANRIKTGRGSLTTSIPTPFEFSWDSHARLYLMEPPNAVHHYLHVNFPGFNIAVTSYTTVQGNLGHLAGAVVQGNIGLTTQLSGCSIFYSVQGGNLVVAHLWPDAAAAVKTNLPPALAGQAALPAGAVLALRVAHEGALANALVGGTLGIFGMVANAGDVGLRLVGPRNIRTHGYSDTLGNAYFLAVKLGGNWTLCGQENNPGKPLEGVSNFQQLYP
jgi:hypothetical protein